jgi:hypothetical protein
MTFPSIEIQGSIISSDLLGKIRGEQAQHQQGKDFVPGYTDARLKDEISLAWQEAKGQWTIFKSKLARLKEGETGTSETRNFWMVPLLTNLGYNLNFNRQSEDLNGKSFPIGYRDTNLDNFPIFIGGYNESLDRRPDSKLLRVSPHALMQEYLNHSEYLYGLVTNGRQLRLLRDASRITRLSYVEFNLEKMMDEDLYTDFVLFYRLLHASRMPKTMDTGSESILEHYHQDGLAAGSTIRSNLGMAVEKAILNLANGFVNHPENAALRKAIDDGQLDPDEYYRHMLRIIYRLLFLFVIEERNLVYADSKTPETKRFAQIYFSHFSLMRLRKLAGKLQPPEAERHYDCWQGLLNTFALFEKPALGRQLGIMALQGDLFGYHAITCPHYDLHQCRLSNKVLLDVVKSLSYFENENKVGIAVNYGGLDVEEFGSVYEGMLELKLKGDYIPGTEQYRFDWANSGERGKSGSHYTPEELVQPLIKHSLDYLIADRLKEKNPVDKLLALKVADIACGSGHILLSAARRIAHEVACLQETTANNSREKVEQPSPSFFRKAMKDVIKNCIFGVDKNPLAVELCKIALWLEAYNPGEPLNFLDHHIKCGDAIVGLAHRDELEKGIPNEAFKTLPGDDKDIAKTFRDRNVHERKQRADKATQIKTEYEAGTENMVQEASEEYNSFIKLPETTPEEIERKARAYQKFLDGKGYGFLKTMADALVGQFFMPKIEAHKNELLTDGDFRLMMKGQKGWQGQRTGKAKAVAAEKGIFHWFLEYPDIMQAGGFDCILGNPPYLGGSKISGYYGDYFLSFLKNYYYPAEGLTDLISYFFRRNFEIIKTNSFFSVITTNSVYQGDSRESSLDIIYGNKGHINFAKRSIKWPGQAKLIVSLISILKGDRKVECYLDDNKVSYISQYLDTSISNKPKILFQNHGQCFIGSSFLGTGFVINKMEYDNLKHYDPEGKVLFPTYNGDDLNNAVELVEMDYAIYFNEMSLSEADEYPELLEVLRNRVLPERLKSKQTQYVKQFWKFKRPTVELYKRLENSNKHYITSLTTRYLNFTQVNRKNIYSHAIGVVIPKELFQFPIIQSTFHSEWSTKEGSSLANTIRYTPSDCYETFPFPQDIISNKKEQLETIGEDYQEYRRQLMISMKLGLTKTYNWFHSNAITPQSINSTDSRLASLQKHLEKTPGTISFDEAIQGILKLRELHVEMDNAVLDAYGWGQDYIDEHTGEVISGLQLHHNFYEVDYLPENDRIRFTIHPTARKEVLKRLLELNHKIHDEEVKAGLWDKKGKKGKTYLIQEDEEGNRVEEPDSSLGGLFNQ